MQGVNKIWLVGYVGKDPLLSYINGEKAMVKFSIATEDGGTSSPTQWHQIVVWNELAEQTIQAIRKGDLVWVEGHIHYQEWTDKHGYTQRTASVVAKHIQRL